MSWSFLSREHRASKGALFDEYDGLEEGGLKASSSYSSGIDEHDNDKAIDGLKERAVFLKRLTGDIHEEVESHNRLLDRMGNSMDASRGIMSGTMDRFKMVFEKKSNRRICTLVGSFVVSFFVLYYLIRVLMRGWSRTLNLACASLQFGYGNWFTYNCAACNLHR